MDQELKTPQIKQQTQTEPRAETPARPKEEAQAEVRQEVPPSTTQILSHDMTPEMKVRLFQAALQVVGALTDDQDVLSMQSLIAPGTALPVNPEDVSVIFRVELFRGSALVKSFQGAHQMPALLSDASLPEAHSIMESVMLNSMLRPCLSQFTKILNNIVNEESGENAFQSQRLPAAATGNLSSSL